MMNALMNRVPIVHGERRRLQNPVRVLRGGAVPAGAGEPGDIGRRGGGGGRGGGGRGGGMGRGGRGGRGGGMSGGVRRHGHRHHRGRGRGFYPYYYGGFYPYYPYPYAYPYYYSPYSYYGGPYGYPTYAASYGAQQPQQQSITPQPQSCCADETYGELDCPGKPGDGTPIQITNRKFYAGGEIVYVKTPQGDRDGWYWTCPPTQQAA